jgi:hypothetical protein
MYVHPGEYRVDGEIAQQPGRLVISEVMAHPDGDEAAGEYVELYNPEGFAVDMEFHSLLWSGGAEQTAGACGRPTVISPGGYGLVAGEGFDAAGAPGVPLACVQGRLAVDGVQNSAGQRVELKKPDGTAVSSYSGWLSSSEGLSIERVSLAGTDEESNWAYSVYAGGSPGAVRGTMRDRDRAPALIMMKPSGSDVSPDATFRLLFDMEVVCAASEGCVKVYDREGCSGKEWAATTAWSGAGGEVVNFRPAKTLSPGVQYWISAGGFMGASSAVAGAGNCLEIRTGSGADSVHPKARIASPQDGATKVPINLRGIHVEFSEPVHVSAGALSIIGGEGPLECTPAGGDTLWECELNTGLNPSRGYSIDVIGEISDRAGNLARRGRAGGFTSGEQADHLPPELSVNVRSLAPGGVALNWGSSEPCALEWKAVDQGTGGVVGSGAAGLPASGGAFEVGSAIGAGGVAITAGCRDAAGNTGEADRIVITPEQLPPPVALNEVMQNPGGADTSAEFIELYNYGDSAVDLTGWAIARCESGDPAIIDPKGGMLPPGGYALLVTAGDPCDAYPWGARIIRIDSILGSLSNSKRESLCLLDESGVLVSSYSGHIMPVEGLSASRDDPERPDVSGNWILSKTTGGTPGSKNHTP